MVVATLSEWLRARSDDHLELLLRKRPDLAHPVPPDIGALADRVTSKGSVARALDLLDAFSIQVLEALSLLPEPTAVPDVEGSLNGTDAREALDDLRDLALVWGGDDELHLIKTARQLLVSPAGLGPPADVAFRETPPSRLRQLISDLGLDRSADPPRELGAHLADPAAIEALIARAGGDAKEVLERLAWGPPAGTVEKATREVRIDTARSPIDRLLALGLLAATNGNTVVLPREVGMHLRGGRVFRRVQAEPPAIETERHDPQLVDKTAAGQALTLTQRIEDLLELWGADPPPVLRAGGLGVRELRRTARELDIEDDLAAQLIETAHAAGLVGASGGFEGDWLPTHGYDLWLAGSPERRWTSLAMAWLQTTRVAGLVGGRDERDRPINALGLGVDRASAPEVRERVLGILAELPPGSSATEDAVRARLAWLLPRRESRLRDRLVTWILHEANTLGLSALNTMSAHGRRMLARDRDGAEQVLADLLPEPIDHVLLQADLTAIAPGPLLPDLAREFSLTADVESTGGATVYRFSESSIRRALDAGRTVDDVLNLLDAHSRTPVPQPLRYLVEDVARRHGRIRVGTASAYVRCDDPGTLNEVLADRRSAALGLRRLAPTVVASRSPRGVLVEQLRSMGYAPVAESLEGDVVIARSDGRRAGATARPARPPADPRLMDERLATAAVQALRAGDRAHRGTGVGDTGAGVSTTEVVSALETLSGSGRRVWIGYLDAQGRPSGRVVEPLRVDGGYLTAYDATRDVTHRFVVHRITGVTEVEDDDWAGNREGTTDS